MLARRELFSTQLRERLTRKGFSEADTEAALSDLRQDGALNDQRAAAAYAHDAATLKLRSPRRTRRELGQLGLTDKEAQGAVETAYADIDERVLVERALLRRHAGPIVNGSQFRRLFQSLQRLGFDHDVIHNVLRGRLQRLNRSESADGPDHLV